MTFVILHTSCTGGFSIALLPSLGTSRTGLALFRHGLTLSALRMIGSRTTPLLRLSGLLDFARLYDTSGTTGSDRTVKDD